MTPPEVTITLPRWVVDSTIQFLDEGGCMSSEMTDQIVAAFKSGLAVADGSS